MTGRLSRWGTGFLAGTVVITVAMTTVVACGSGGEAGGGKTALRFVWWGNDDRAKATKSAIDLFTRNNPDITVSTEFSAYDAYFQKLSTEVAGGAGPDLLQLDRATLGEYQHRNVLAELNPYAGNALKVSDVPKELLVGGQVAGKQYAIPAGQTTQMLAYDPALFDKAGVPVPASWTWSQFQDAVRRIGGAGVSGTTDFGWAIDWFEVWLHQRGKKLYTDDGKVSFAPEDLRQFWTMTGDLRKANGVSAPEVTTKMDGSMQNSGLVTKHAASEINYDSSLTAYLSSYGPTIKAAPLPTDGSDSGMAALPSVMFAVSGRSAHKDAAVKLLDFLTNDPEAGKLLRTVRGMPPNKQTRTQVCGAATGGDKAVCDYETSVAARIGPATGLWPSGSAAVKRDFQRTYDDVIFGRISVDDGAARVVQQAQQALSQ